MRNEEKYLEALITNDSDITLEIYNRFFPKIESFILNNKGEKDDAQDVFQDALMYLIYVQREKSIQIVSFEAYLFTICKNIWKRRLKNKKEWVMKESYDTLVDNTPDISSFILEQERLELYNENFTKLSDNCKDILALYFNTMDYADLLNTFSYNSIDVARQRVFKCRQKLIQLIKADKRYKKLKDGFKF